MKIATLALIIRTNNGRNELLLGLKKTGEIGKGLYNAPGGKRHLDEGLRACMVREIEEEVGIVFDETELEEVALLDWYSGDDLYMRVYVYMARVYAGNPRSTASMDPAWYDVSNLPLHLMHEGDVRWLPKVLRGDRYTIQLHYKEPGSGFMYPKFRRLQPFPTDLTEL